MLKWVFDCSSSDYSPSDTKVAQDDQDTEDSNGLPHLVESDSEEDHDHYKRKKSSNR